MDKTVIVYKSKYGATKTYAQWIGEELECPVISLDDFAKNDLKNFDNIIYGGGVQAGGIKGFDKFGKWIKPYLMSNEKKIVIFAVGINVDESESRMQLRDINFGKNPFQKLTCYYLSGAYDPLKINGADKLIMNMVKKMLEGKGELEKTEGDKKLLQLINEGGSLIDRQKIAPIVAEFKK